MSRDCFEERRKAMNRHCGPAGTCQCVHLGRSLSSSTSTWVTWLSCESRKFDLHSGGVRTCACIGAAQARKTRSFAVVDVLGLPLVQDLLTCCNAGACRNLQSLVPTIKLLHTCTACQAGVELSAHGKASQSVADICGKAATSCRACRCGLLVRT